MAQSHQEVKERVRRVTEQQGNNGMMHAHDQEENNALYARKAEQRILLEGLHEVISTPTERSSQSTRRKFMLISGDSGTGQSVLLRSSSS